MTPQTHTFEALKNICRHTYFWNKADMPDESEKVCRLEIELKLIDISEDYSSFTFHLYKDGIPHGTISLTAEEAINQLIPIV